MRINIFEHDDLRMGNEIEYAIKKECGTDVKINIDLTIAAFLLLMYNNKY